MNKKGLVISIPILIISLVLLTAGTVGVHQVVKDWLDVKGEDNYDGIPIVNTNPVYIPLNEGDPKNPDEVSKYTIMDVCKRYKSAWNVDPVLKINLLGTIKCATCTEVATIPSLDMSIIEVDVYRSITNCEQGQADAPLNENILKIEKEKEEKQEILDECPPLVEMGGVPIVRDFMCEWKLKLVEYFTPLLIGASVLLAIIMFLISLAEMNKLFKRKKERTRNLVLAIIIGLIFGALFYFYFIGAVIALILYLIITALMEMYKKK